MTDFDAWWKENYEGIAYILKDDARDCWNASRAALTEGMEPVAYMYPKGNGFVLCFNKRDDMQLGTEIYTADQLATAVANERERCADLAESRRAFEIAAAIRGMKP